MDRNTITIAIYVIGAFIGGGSLALFYSAGQTQFLIRDMEMSCDTQIEAMIHEELQHMIEDNRAEIDENDDAARRRDKRVHEDVPVIEPEEEPHAD